jgi:hypothetical protein
MEGLSMKPPLLMKMRWSELEGEEEEGEVLVLAIRMMDIRFVFSSLIYSLTTNKLFLSERDTQQNLLERKWIPDDCVAERGTGIPLDLVIIIKNYLYDTLTDQNFCEAIALWIENEECKFRFSHHGDRSDEYDKCLLDVPWSERIQWQHWSMEGQQYE